MRKLATVEHRMLHHGNTLPPPAQGPQLTHNSLQPAAGICVRSSPVSALCSRSVRVLVHTCAGTGARCKLFVYFRRWGVLRSLNE
eukprot:scaffold4495_cov117-Isochrysis_galbana.AAC.4